MSSGKTEHYTYFMHLTHNQDIQKYLCGFLISCLLILIGSRLARKIKGPEEIMKNLIPSKKPSVFGWLDFVFESFVKYQDSILGKENRRYISFTFTFFIFIFVCNVIGLIPGMPAATTTVWINVGMALCVFIYFNYQGVKEHGSWGYVKHFFGPILLLSWMVFPLEILGLFIRILTLNLRLYWNITADHLVLGILTDLGKYFAAPVYMLGIFVSFMQAFVFTTLIMIYILLAIQHEDDGHESHVHN